MVCLILISVNYLDQCSARFYAFNSISNLWALIGISLEGLLSSFNSLLILQTTIIVVRFKMGYSEVSN
jgi:hypothetical protein